MVPWTHPSPQHKRHLDRCSRSAGHSTVTDRPTNHATRTVTIGRIYVRSIAMRPKRFESNYYRLSDSFNHSVNKLITYSFMHQMQNTEYIAPQKMNTF